MRDSDNVAKHAHPDLWMPECEYYDDQHALPRNEELVRVRVELQEASARSYSSSESSSPQDPRYDPGLAVLTGSQNLIFRFNVEAPSEPQKTASSIMPMMTDKADEPPLAGEAPAEHQTAQDAPKPHDDAASSESSTTQVVHAKTLRSVEAQSDPIIASKQFASRTRADSMQAEASSSIQEKSPLRSGLASPLKLKTSDSGTAAPAGLRRESISSSPTLSKHTIHGAVEQNLAPFEPPSPSASSPQAERLPSIHQLTSTLTELAEAATQELPRQQAFSHNHRQSFGSANAQSPVLSNHPYPASVQTSPQAYFPPVMARSPTSTLGESPAYASPPAYPGFGPYSHRRPSMADGMPPMIPTLHSASSSGESGGGYHSSGTEGYSTNHTTPIDVGQVSENTPRPLLPPPPGMHALPPAPAPMMIQGLYKCDVPNCTAGTFQTQYLLK